MKWSSLMFQTLQVLNFDRKSKMNGLDLENFLKQANNHKNLKYEEDNILYGQ